MYRALLITFCLNIVGFAAARGADIPPDVARLKKNLESNSAVVRKRALVDLARLGPPAADARTIIEKSLKADSLDERLTAAAALVRCGVDEKRYEELLGEIRSALQANSAESRDAALNSLRLIGPQARKEYPIVIASLFSPFDGSGNEPYAAIAKPATLRALNDAFGAPSKESVPTLIDALANANPNARFDAESLLWQAFQAGHVERAEALLPILKHKEAHARLAAIKALARFEKVPVSMLDAVADAIIDSVSRPYAVEILVRSSPASRDHLPAIRKALSADPLAQAWVAARMDPGAYGPEAAKLIVARLRTLLPDLSKPGAAVEVRQLCRMLEPLGPMAREAVPMLGQCLELESIREDASAALKAAGREAVPALRAALRANNSGEVQMAAVTCILELGPEAREAVPELNVLLTSNYRTRGFLSTTLSVHALHALAAIGPAGATPDALAAVKTRLRSPDAGLEKLLTLTLIPRFGPSAKELVPDLVILAGKPGKAGEDGLPNEKELYQFLALGGLIAVDPSHPSIRDSLVRMEKESGTKKDRGMFEIVAGMDEITTIMNGQMSVNCRSAALLHLEGLQASIRKRLFAKLDTPATKGNPTPECPSEIGWSVALARANPKDVPLAIKVIEHALDSGMTADCTRQTLTELARFGPAATPVLRRFLDRQPLAIACIGESQEPVSNRGGGGCMFCAPSRSSVLGLISPPEPFLPGSLKVPVYSSSQMRGAATEALTKTASKP